MKQALYNPRANSSHYNDDCQDYGPHYNKVIHTKIVGDITWIPTISNHNINSDVKKQKIIFTEIPFIFHKQNKLLCKVYGVFSTNTKIVS